MMSLCLAKPLPDSPSQDRDVGAKAVTAGPKPDFRELRTRLKGVPLAQVFAVLGKPAHVFTVGSNESWEYSDAAYDPISKRTVRRLEIWFRDGHEDYMTASF